MRKNYLVFLLVLIAGIAVGIFATRAFSAEENLAKGKILKTLDIQSAPGMEAILVLRELPAGAESGYHKNPAGEIGYVLEGSVVFEEKGKAPVTLKTGDTFTTVGGEVHNVKNASKTEGGKALAFYIVKKGTKLEEVSVPAQ